MNFRDFLPPKAILLVILVFALINPLHYVMFSLNTPEGMVFVGHVDDTLQLTVLSALRWDFADPWYEGTVFENVVIGAPFTYTLIGIPLTFLGLNTLAAFLIVKFILAAVLLILVYNFMKFFLKENTNLGFLLLLFIAGIGWIVYGASYFAFGPQYTPLVGYMLTSEFDELGGGGLMISHLTRIYWILPEIMGFLSMLLFFHGRKWLAGLALGLAFLFYPTFAVPFALFIALYALVTSEGPVSRRIRSTIWRLVPVAIIAAPFAAVWGLIYILNPAGIELYRAEWFGFNSRPLITMIISSFLR